jgi:hypothetical protein
MLGFTTSCAPAEPPAKPPLAIMSALPLFWGEGGATAVLQGDDQRAPLIRHLAQNHTLAAIDHLDQANLVPSPILLLAQPRGLSPDELVALDDWVRGGGRVLIFADPILLWPSRLAMGDRRRAPLVTLLDPLLTHWGLVLEGPSNNNADVVAINSYIAAGAGAGVGRWESKTENCKASPDQRLAECRIGKGLAILIADADVLDLNQRPANVALIDSLILRVAQ